jgi:hypothetical protein
MSALSCVHYDWQRVNPGVSYATRTTSFHVAHPFAPNEVYAASHGAGFDSRTKQHTIWPINKHYAVAYNFVFGEVFHGKLNLII